MTEGKPARSTFVALTILLVLEFFGQLRPAGEAPSPTLNTITILIELGLLVGLVGLAPKVLRSIPEGPRRQSWIFLLVVGVLAAIGIFGMRLSSRGGEELQPRTASAPSRAEELRKKLRALILSMERRSENIGSSRWAQALSTRDPAKIRTLTRADLKAFRETCRGSREDAEAILKVFAEADSKKIDLSSATSEPGAARAETWRVALEGMKAATEYLGLIDQHWDEWVADPFPAGSNQKPWQLEVTRLGDVAAEASTKFNALLESGTAPTAAPAEVAALEKKLRDLAGSWETLGIKLHETRWIKTADEQRRKLSRRDLQEVIPIFREMRDQAEQFLKVLTEVESKSIPISGAEHWGGTTRPEYWRAQVQACSAAIEKFTLIEQNWDDFAANPFPEAESEWKPWQREMRRLEDVLEARIKETKALDSPGTTPAPAPSRPWGDMNNIAVKTAVTVQVNDYKRALARLEQTAWKKAPDRQTITSADLHDANEKLGGVIAAVDQIIAGLKTSALPAPESEKEYWRVKREISLLSRQLTAVLEENFNEWHSNGIRPETGQAKPWQKEALRLESEIDKLNKMEVSSIFF